MGDDSQIIKSLSKNDFAVLESSLYVLVSLFNGISTFVRLFKAKGILLEEQ